MANPSLNDIQRLMTDLVFPVYQVDRIAMPPFEPRRWENDAEHCWSVAFLACSLAPEIDKGLDIGKIAQFAIVHDVLEIYSGDTSPFDIAGTSSKKSREAAALKKVYKNFKQFPWISETIKEYELKNGNEARFVWAVDKFIILMLRYLDKGKYYVDNGITKNKFDNDLMSNREKAHSNAVIGGYYDQLLRLFELHPEYFYIG